MIYAQNKDPQMTELLIGGVQIGTPTATQKWVDEFLASRRQGLSIRTFEYYRDILYPFVGTDLTPKGINAWLTSLNVGNAKYNNYQVLKIFCNWLRRSKKIHSNPMELVDKPKRSIRIMPAITINQLSALLQYVDNPRDECLIRFLFDSGCRLSEVVSIKDTDFDWDNGTVIVIGKGNIQRKAPFTEITEKHLRRWFSEHKTFELNKYGVQTMLRRLEKKTGIDCNPHAFRHGFVNNQFRQGKAPQDVMNLGGWHDIKTVMKYAEQYSQEDSLKHYDRG